jgi:hypothetical protein
MLNIGVITERDTPRVIKDEISIECLDKYSFYIGKQNNEDIEDCDIFKILDIIKEKILALRHDDRIKINIESNLFWDYSIKNWEELKKKSL